MTGVQTCALPICPRTKKAKIWEKRDHNGKKVGLSSRRYSNYTPLKALLDQVLMQIKDNQSLKWPERMKGDPNKRNKANTVIFTATMDMIWINAMT